MDALQNQMSTGRKFAHISDDPIALIYSQAARNTMTRIVNFQRSVQTAGDWLMQAEDGIMDMQRTMQDLYAATLDASTDAKGIGDESDKRNIAPVIAQLRDNILDNLNITLGNRFMFGGHNTPGDPAETIDDKTTRPFTIERGNLHFNGFNISQFDGIPSAIFNNLFSSANPPSQVEIDDAFAGTGFNPEDFGIVDEFGVDTGNAAIMHRLMNDTPTLAVGPGSNMPITVNGIDLALFMTPGVDENGVPLVDSNGNRVMVMRNLWNVADDLYEKVNSGAPANEIDVSIRPLQDAQNYLLTKAAEIGGRVRRLEMLEARYEQSMINFERIRSEAEDVDFAETLMHFKMAEAVYQAALSAGARIIQPTLMDFLR